MSSPGAEQLTIVRNCYMSQATLGRILLPGVPYALHSLERPWIPNPAGLGGMPRISCVPDGLYKLYPHESERHPHTLQIVNEALGVYRDALPAGQKWGRFAILIHPATQADELEGCIAPGTNTVIYDNTPSLLMSKDALELVLGCIVTDRPATLWIRPSAGTREIAFAQPPKSGTPRVVAPTMV
ncbi:MAG TPA: DUF5675 family protein [Gammaproteobacteria bacterium]|nr:DUF5675 family protein [Gammaproteobacteria bacterium]